jgi:hypothetical protein
MKTGHEIQVENAEKRLLRAVGIFPSVERFLSRYGKPWSRAEAPAHLVRQLEWLDGSKEIRMTRRIPVKLNEKVKKAAALARDQNCLRGQASRSHLRSLSKRLIWIDSLAMGAVLILAGFAMFLAATGIGFPSYIGFLVLGILLLGAGVALVRQGLRNRPHEQRT